MKESLKKSAKSLFKIIPVIIGTILLVSLVNTLIPKNFYWRFLGRNQFLGVIIGSLVGSISAGNPLTSYVLGGEMLKQGVSLLVVTAFLNSWVTVGIIQLPAEGAILGKRFAFWRNFTAFLLSIIVAFATVFLYNLIS